MAKFVSEEKEGRMLEPKEYKHHPLSCSACGEPICDVVEMDPVEFPVFFRGKCPCGDYSYIEEVNGQPFLHPAEGRLFENFIDEEIDGKPVHTIVTRKAI